MTDTTHFKAITAALDTNLTSWTSLYCEQENITLCPLPPPPPPPPAFRTQPYEDHSDTTFSMYMSAFTNMYALQDDSCDHPPQFNGPSSQSWSPPSTISYAATVSISDTSPSQISEEAFEKVTQENACLSRHVDELVAQVSALVPQSKYTVIEPITQSTSDQVQAIINQAAAAVLSTIKSSRKRQPTRTTEVLELSTSHSNAMLDTSFNSVAMHHE